jgi:hypothetical protein
MTSPDGRPPPLRLRLSGAGGKTGDLTLTIQGQPPRKLKGGDSFSVPPQAVHTGTAGDQGVKLIGVFVVDKTKPLAIPAPMTQ